MVGVSRFDVDGVRRELGGERFADVRWLAETGSTNSDLLAVRGGVECVLVADTQTAGRGRLGRVWESAPATSLLMSVRVTSTPDDLMAPQVALALAVVEHCRAHGVEVGLKWPNDVMVGSAKLAGLLAESSSSSGTVEAVVVGLGLNLDWSGKGPPGSIDLVALGVPGERAQLVPSLLRRMAANLRFDHAERRRRYEAACATIGRRVRVEKVDGVIEGNADAIADDGALVVCVDGVDVTVHVGDVVHLR